MTGRQVAAATGGAALAGGSAALAASGGSAALAGGGAALADALAIDVDNRAKGSAGAGKNARDESSAAEQGGQKEVRAEKPAPAPRAARNITIDGLGVGGGLSLAGVTNHAVLKILDELGMELPPDIGELITLLLDAKGKDCVGLRKAIEEKIDQLALEWCMTVEKTTTVLWLAFRRAYRVLEAGGDDAVSLRRAMAQIFKDGKDQRSLEHFLSQTGALLNDWSCSKPVCGACVEKSKHGGEFGYDEAIAGARIVRIKSSGPSGEFMPLAWVHAHMPEKLTRDGRVYAGSGRLSRPRMIEGFEYHPVNVGARQVADGDLKPLLHCMEGDVLIVDEGVDVAAAVDFVPVSKVWSFATQTKLAEPLFGWVPKKCIETMFGECTCWLWNTAWRPFTSIVLGAIADVKSVLPDQRVVGEQLVVDASNLPPRAQRLHRLFQSSVSSVGLETSLSSTFLGDNAPLMQVALSNLVDTEQGSADLRAWTRVFCELAAVEQVALLEGEKFVCQLLSRKAAKAIVRDVLDPFVITGDLSAGFGVLWRPQTTLNDIGAGLERFGAGWKTAGLNENVDVSSVPPSLAARGQFMWAELARSISNGMLPYAPFPFLRGIKETPKTFGELAALPTRLVLISCVDGDAAFERSLGGSLTRLLLAPILKRFRSALIVFASPAWCLWWKERLFCILAMGEKGAKSTKKKQREVVEFSIGGNGLPSGQELLTRTEAQQAAGLQLWYDFTYSDFVGQKDEGGAEEEDGDDELVVVAKAKSPKESLSQYYHRILGPLYPISVSDDVFNSLQANNAAAVPSLTEAQVSQLTRPMLWLFSNQVHEQVYIYGEGQGVIVSDALVRNYEKRLDDFIGRPSDLRTTLNFLAGCRSYNEICELFLGVKGMPFTLARLPENLAGDLVHLCLGQDYKGGWTFANQVQGSSVPVRFVHRAAGFADNQFATWDVLPCSHDWSRDLDFFVSCSSCRPALVAGRKYDELKHITPALPEEPKHCEECKRRWCIVMDWLVVLLAAMLRAVSLSGASIFVTPCGVAARTVWNRLCGASPQWLKDLTVIQKLKTPTEDVCHPNAVSFARTEGQVRQCRAQYGRLAIELRNFRTGSKSRRWDGGMSSFYAQLHAVYSPFNPNVLSAKRMAAASSARVAVTRLVEREVRKLNFLLGKGESLDPIDQRFRLTRVISQIHLQKLAVSPELAMVVETISAKATLGKAPDGDKAKVDAAEKTATEGGGPTSLSVTRTNKRAFARRCYNYLMDRLSEPNIVRRPLLARLGLEVSAMDPAADLTAGRAKGWKQTTARSFEHCVLALFGKWRHPVHQQDLEILMNQIGPAPLLDCFFPASDSAVAQFGLFGEPEFVLREKEFVLREKEFCLREEKVRELLMQRKGPEPRPAE